LFQTEAGLWLDVRIVPVIGIILPSRRFFDGKSCKENACSEARDDDPDKISSMGAAGIRVRTPLQGDRKFRCRKGGDRRFGWMSAKMSQP
jgi:hypothetical protein